MEIKKHTPLRLSDRGYKRMCGLVDKRDGHKCIICECPDVQRPDCHSRYGHGIDKEDWQVKFINYLNSKECKEFEHKVKKKVEYIYKCCMKRGDKNWLKKE